MISLASREFIHIICLFCFFTCLSQPTINDLAPRINEDSLKGSFLTFDHSLPLPRHFLDKTIKQLSDFFTWLDPQDIYLFSWITPLLKNKNFIIIDNANSTPYLHVPLYKQQIMEKSISSVEQLLSFFKTTQHHLFYIGPIYGTTLLNLNDYYPNFEILTCHDPYKGAFPFVTVPESFRDTHKECITGSICKNNILKDPAVIAYMKQKDPHPNVIFLHIDNETEELCKQHGFYIWGTTVHLYNYLGNKVKIIDLLIQSNIPFIPNVRSQINSYQHLRELTASFGVNKIVVQDQDGFGGWGTFAIQNENDYNSLKKDLQNGKQYRIMPFRRLKCFAIGAVATKAGTIIGPLLSQLIGHEQLTTYWGGYCGNELRKTYFQDSDVQLKVRREIAEYTVRFGDFLYREGLFRGIFGFDFSVDIDTNEVFFMQINPRLTGSTTVAFQVYEAQGHKFPIILYHCLQFLGIDIDMDVAKLNEEWIALDHYDQEVSHIILRPLSNAQKNIPYAYPGGFWKIQGNQVKHTGKVNFRLTDMQPDEVFFKPNRGFSKANLVIKRTCQDYNFKLTEEAKQLISKFNDFRMNSPA